MFRPLSVAKRAPPTKPTVSPPSLVRLSQKMSKMNGKAKGPQAVRLRQRKLELLRRFQIPEDLLPGSLSQVQIRCGKPTCHCAAGDGHPAWYFSFMADGKKRKQHIPHAWVQVVRQRVEAGRQYQDAVREVLTANAELLVLARQQRQ